jgi:hypothetical protein
VTSTMQHQGYRPILMEQIEFEAQPSLRKRANPGQGLKKYLVIGLEGSGPVVGEVVCISSLYSNTESY